MLAIKKIKKQLKADGYVLIKGFFLKTKEYENFKKFLYKFVKFALKKKKNIDIDRSLSLRFKKNKKISAFLNDYINLSPYLSLLFTSNKLASFLSKILDEKKDKIVFNNQRFRIQIPGNDEIANLPWHQDISYNTIKGTKSIVAWVSLGNISEDMGPIIFKKGSHKFGIQKPIKFKKNNGGTAIKVDLNNVNLKDLIDVQLKTLSGDLILIDMNTIHTSGRNRTKDKVKYSAQARYHVVRQH
jgi:ectoine hydroxylase-related dioxygenase (phytanoyl-CoA dioxygenase family)